MDRGDTSLSQIAEENSSKSGRGDTRIAEENSYAVDPSSSSGLGRHPHSERKTRLGGPVCGKMEETRG
ncbi:hypothetical protein FNV43_RR11015 [Rhamnella rubrinervis]|uniref:Uncharacterized protein n=1 Tax=Rhamnella rubrinervis TaxID=2594499 RepID=A0A8K0MHG6_9ROSA|nr:hypothetical protein FNV43_RR11015 [Rhamnella rubrinervis]